MNAIRLGFRKCGWGMHGEPLKHLLPAVSNSSGAAFFLTFCLPRIKASFSSCRITRSFLPQHVCVDRKL